MAILQYQGCYISHTASTVGRIEAEGPLGACFDLIERDPYFGEESWEKAESEMVHRTLNVLLKKAAKKPEEIDLILGGDLLNQCTASTFAVSELKIPFLGLYGACSTAAESLLIGSRFCCGGQTKRAIAFAGSHFCSSERQFRFPLEYGNQKTPTAQCTVTGAGAFLIDTEDDRGVEVCEGLIGRIIDNGVKDANNMGAAMATAAVDTILRYFNESGRNAEDFDCIVTGDLGAEGKEIAEVLLKKCGFDPKGRLTDCGMLIFDREKQDVNSGGSGCGCSATVTASHFYPRLRSGELHDMLLIGTGALLSPKTVLQKESIPSVAHLVHLRRTQK